MSNEIIAALHASELFRDLPQKQLKRICDAGKVMSFQAGAEVGPRAKVPGRFFTILDGTAEVFGHGVHRGELGSGRRRGRDRFAGRGTPNGETGPANSDLRTFSLASWNFRPFLGEPEVMCAR